MHFVLLYTVVPHAGRFLSLFLSSFSSSISVSCQLQPSLYIPLYLLVHGILTERVLPDCVCRGKSEHMKVSKCFNCLKYTIFSYVSCRSTLTEENSLDGEVLYFVLVISSPPVDVFGQSVSKKLCHCPPHTMFVGQTSRQVEVRDLHRKNDVHINSLVYTPCGIPPPQKTIYNNCYK